MEIEYILKKNNIDPCSKIILFDGVCNLCDFFVKMVVKNDKKNIFMLVPIDSAIGKEFFGALGIKSTTPPQTVFLISEQRVYKNSTASLLILKEFGFIGKVFYSLFILLPPALRDSIYKFIAKNRYRFFGKKTKCNLLEKNGKILH